MINIIMYIMCNYSYVYYYSFHSIKRLRQSCDDYHMDFYKSKVAKVYTYMYIICNVSSKISLKQRNVTAHNVSPLRPSSLYT